MNKQKYKKTDNLILHKSTWLSEGVKLFYSECTLFQGSAIVINNITYHVSHFCNICKICFYSNDYKVECPSCKDKLYPRKFGEPLDGR